MQRQQQRVQQDIRHARVANQAAAALNEAEGIFDETSATSNALVQPAPEGQVQPAPAEEPQARIVQEDEFTVAPSLFDDANTHLNTEGQTYESIAFERFLAFVYIRNAHRDKYGSVIKNLSSQFSLGNDQYPKTVHEARTVLESHPFDAAWKQRLQRLKSQNQTPTPQPKKEDSTSTDEAKQEDSNMDQYKKSKQYAESGTTILA